MASPKVDRNRIAQILIDAQTSTDAEAAKKHGVTTRTVERYRARMQRDPELSAMVGQKSVEFDRSWHAARSKTLRAIMKRIEELVGSETDLDKVSRAAKNVGEIDVAAGALNGGAGADPKGPETPEDPGDDSGGDGGDEEPEDVVVQ